MMSLREIPNSLKMQASAETHVNCLRQCSTEERKVKRDKHGNEARNRCL